MNIKSDIKEWMCLFASGAALLLAAGGCSVDEEGTVGSPGNFRPQSIGIHSGQSTLAANNTRATGAFTLITSGVAGFSVKGNGGRDNVPYAYGTPWTASGTDGILLSGSSSLTVAAYYPYDGGAGGIYSASGADAKLRLEPGLYEPANDLCAGIFEASEKDNSPVITLDHLYARVSVRVVKQAGYTAPGHISKVSIMCYPSAEYGLFTGNYIPASNRSQKQFSTDIMAGDANSIFEALFIPDTNVPVDIPCTFVIDKPAELDPNNPVLNDSDYMYRVDIPKSLFASTGGGLKAGFQYRFKVMLGEGDYQVVADDQKFLPVDGWNEADITNGDYKVTVDDDNCISLSKEVDPYGNSYGGGNCWVIPRNAKTLSYAFVPLMEGQSTDRIGTTAPAAGLNRSARLIWENTSGLMASPPAYKDGRIQFTVGAGKTGSAVIAITDGVGSNGNILWSWHIWVVDDNSFMQATGGNSGDFMMRNLGADGTAYGNSTGLLYQWGRKDPFAIDANLTKIVRNSFRTVEWSVRNPNTHVVPPASSTNNYWCVGNPNLWNANNLKKYNPCPKGWTVPRKSAYSIANIFYANGTWNDGMTFALPTGRSYFPARGRLITAFPLENQNVGYYWTTDIRGDDNTKAHCLYVAWGDVERVFDIRKFCAATVRCIRE